MNNYFSHDGNASRDPKIIKLLQRHGYYGYGLFWALMEYLFERAGIITLEEHLSALSYLFRVPENELSAIILDMIEYQLLHEDDGKIYSKRMLENLKYQKRVKSKQSEGGKKAMANRYKNSDLDKVLTSDLQGTYKSVISHSNKRKEKKRKEIKLKEIKENNIAQSSENSDSMQELVQNQISILEIDLIKRDGTFTVTQELIDIFKDTYPAVDVLSELKKIKMWCITNPTKRKTKSGILRFLNLWLTKSQDQGNTSRINNQTIKSTIQTNIPNEDTFFIRGYNPDQINKPKPKPQQPETVEDNIEDVPTSAFYELFKAKQNEKDL